MKKSICTMMAVGALLLAGCGETVERPTLREVSASLQDEKSALGSIVPPESADCFAKVLYESELSDGSLNAIVEGDTAYRGKKSDEKVLGSLTEALVGECAPK